MGARKNRPRIKPRSSPARGYNFGCVCSYMAGHEDAGAVTGYFGTNTPKFVPPRWGRRRFDPTQTELCKFGWVWSALNKMEHLAGKGTLDDDFAKTLRHDIVLALEASAPAEPGYPTGAWIEHLTQLKASQSSRIKSLGLDLKAKMKAMKEMKDVMEFLPQAVSEVFSEVQYNPLARPLSADVCDEAEMEIIEVDEDEEDPIPSQEPFLIPDPPRQILYGHQTCLLRSVASSGAQGWKQATMVCEADLANAGVPVEDDEDPDLMDDDLKEALGRSVLDTRHDPFETPNTGGSSGSGGPAQASEVPDQ